MGQCATKRVKTYKGSDGDIVTVIGNTIDGCLGVNYRYMNLESVRKAIIKSLVIQGPRFRGVIDSVRDRHGNWYDVGTGARTSRYSKPNLFTGDTSSSLLPFECIHIDLVWIRFDIPKKYLLASDNVYVLITAFTRLKAGEIYIAGCPGKAIRTSDEKVDITDDILEYLQGDEDYTVRIYYLSHIGNTHFRKRSR